MQLAPGAEPPADELHSIRILTYDRWIYHPSSSLSPRKTFFIIDQQLVTVIAPERLVQNFAMETKKNVMLLIVFLDGCESKLRLSLSRKALQRRVRRLLDSSQRIPISISFRDKLGRQILESSIRDHK